jgi:hypothetical protein
LTIMSAQVSAPRRLVPDQPLFLALVLLILGAVLLLGLYLATPQVEVASTTSAVSAGAVVQPQAPSNQRSGSVCSLTGDLVGDANPAEVARVLCAEQKQRR